MTTLSTTSSPIAKMVCDDLCTGCGVCAGICPQNALRMDWNDKGELVPFDTGTCNKCGLCLTACPNATADESLPASGPWWAAEPDLRFTPALGYYRSAYVGYSGANGYRERGASGGLTTWLLETLLTSGSVDGVISVIPDTNPESQRLFQYAVLRTPAAVRAAANSKYYPVELSSALREIAVEKEDRRYAVVVLPCRALALRRAMQRQPRLRHRIRYLIGLTCGQLPNHYFSEYCAALGGIPPAVLDSVTFRSKAGTVRASAYTFIPKSKSGERGAPIPNNPTQYHLLANGYFLHRACNYCDDVFADAADIVCMDAWLPEYEPDPRGHTLAVTRDRELDALLRQFIGKSEVLRLEPIPIERVLQSQQGVIERKRRKLPGWLYHAVRCGMCVASRRVAADAKVYARERYWIRLREEIMRRSKDAWQVARMNGDLTAFQHAMAPLERRFILLQRRDTTARLCRHPVRALGRLLRKMCRQGRLILNTHK